MHPAQFKDVHSHSHTLNSICGARDAVASRHWYQSCRFNLLREENEGFSKMLVRLQSFGKEAAAHPEHIDQMVRPHS